VKTLLQVITALLVVPIISIIMLVSIVLGIIVFPLFSFAGMIYKRCLLILLLLIPIQLYSQLQATIRLTDDTFINNAPSGRSWKDYKAAGITLYESSDTLVIHNSDVDKITYFGSWSISDKNIPADSNNCYCSFSRTANDSIVFKFTDAESFEWFGERVKHHGIVDIFINNKFDTTINTYSEVGKSPVINYYKYDLDTNKVYKFKLVVTGRKDRNSAGAYIVNQYFRLIHTGQPELPAQINPPQDILIIRSGRFEVFLDGVQHGNKHNEYEKAIEHAVILKYANPKKNVVIKSPTRKIELK